MFRKFVTLCEVPLKGLNVHGLNQTLRLIVVEYHA
jgi:hypothetical protein